MKKTLILLLSILLLAALLLPASAHAPKVIDKGDLLYEQVEESISAACECKRYYGVEFYVVTAKAASYEGAERVLHESCDIGEDDNAIVLLLRCDVKSSYTEYGTKYTGQYYYDMFTYGAAYDIFSDRDVDRILDDPEVYQNLKFPEDGTDIAEGVLRFTSLCQEVIERHHEKELARQKRAPFVALLCGGIVAVLAGGGSMLGVFLFYRRKRRGASYPLDRYARLHLTHCQDTLVSNYITRVRIQSSSAGGRSGGGGGGGHRGGR